MDWEMKEVVDSISKIQSSTTLHRGRSKSICFLDKNSEFCKHEASLWIEENDKGSQMQLYQEGSTHCIDERTIRRASCTVSPRHRHLPRQTTELVAEIELLEEEIANREQYVLSLYRSIFDQCVSGSSSAQSSSMPSPAHPTNGARKHQSKLSSAVFSSKKLPLQQQQLHIPSSSKEPRKHGGIVKCKVRHESLPNSGMDSHIGNGHSDSAKILASGSPVSCKLKDYLNQCPSKISEEMVRCLAALYRQASSDSEEKPDNTCSPFLSRSTTCVMLPRRGTTDEPLPSRSTTGGPSTAMETKPKVTASDALNSYRLLVEQLERVDLSVVERNVKLAFWINVYNCLIMHAHLVYSKPNSSTRTALFHKSAYNIGGHIISANAIEQYLLCLRTPRIGRWFESILLTAMKKRLKEEKKLLESKFGLSKCEPLVLFCLCSGASDDPALRAYNAKTVMDGLEKAKKEFLEANVVTKKSKKIFLPKILNRYAKEASLSSDDLLKWVSENVHSDLRDEILKCMDSKRRKASQVIEWLPYDTTFQYIFAKSLPECVDFSSD